MSARVVWLGHSTVLIEAGGLRVLTDPVLRDRFLHIRRVARGVDAAHLESIDAVLLSHLHYDHLDLPSLRRIGRGVTVVAPEGSGKLLAKHGFQVRELSAGGRLELAPGASVLAVDAAHDSGRMPLGAKADPLGYVLDAGGARIYFAGDTDLFDEMDELSGLDLALIPVWGWGPKLGEGHLDPESAAAAVARLGPRLAVPIHWGTFFPIGRRDRAGRLTDPPHEFARAAARAAPGVEVRVLEPGAALDLEVAA